jgi:hypothetical protein
MHPKGSCKCLHCGEFVEVDARNRGRQRYCRKEACRKASKAESQRRWLGKADNAEYFRGTQNAARVRAWQAAHPGYWRDRCKERKVVLQEISIPQAAATKEVVARDEPAVLQDEKPLLQEILAAQPPVLVGLIAHLTGSVLQEDIASLTHKLHSRGRAVQGLDVPRPDYGKTPPCNGSSAASAAVI